MSETNAHSNHPHTHPGDLPPISGRRGLLFAAAVFVVAAILAVAGIIPRLRAQKQLAQRTGQLALDDVVVRKPELGPLTQDIVLPGNMFAYTDSPINARTDGYLKKWYFDIGAHVRRGQLLAVIASPEIDRELAQAKADLATARSAAGFAAIQSARYKRLLAQNAVTAQDTQNYITQAASTESQVRSALANVQRLQQLVDFEKIYAPFSGTITSRNVDIGTLITTGSTQLFHLDDEHVMRVYVNVPQADSPECTPGTQADLTLDQYPGRVFHGKVVRTARAMDPASRTLLVEVDVPNPQGLLVPGDYTQVHFHVKVAKRAMIVPVSTLIFRQQGLRVATVVNGDIAKLVPITISQDDGNVAQVIEGLQPDSLVVQSPPDSLITGEKVRVVQPSDGGIPGEPQPAPAAHPQEGK
jgi:RND family efflux transporter MFP subunit